MSRRRALNIAAPTAQVVTGRRPKRARGYLGRVLAVVGQPLEDPLDLLRFELAEVVHGPPLAELARGARGRDRWAASVRLETNLDRPAVAHAQEEAREVAAASVLVLADAVGGAHEAGVAGVEEVVHERRTVPHATPAGMACRSFLTSGSMHSITYSMSSAVVEQPSEQRTAPIAQSSGTPIATSTCDSSTLPDVHADPADTPMPLRSSPSTMDSDSTCRKRRLAVPGSRSVGWPESRTSGTRSRTSSMRRFRSTVRRSASACMSRPRISAALRRPSIPG